MHDKNKNMIWDESTGWRPKTFQERMDEVKAKKAAKLALVNKILSKPKKKN